MQTFKIKQYINKNGNTMFQSSSLGQRTVHVVGLYNNNNNSNSDIMKLYIDKKLLKYNIMFSEQFLGFVGLYNNNNNNCDVIGAKQFFKIHVVDTSQKN